MSTVVVAEKSFAIQFLREPGYVKPIDVKVSFSTDEDQVVEKVTGLAYSSRSLAILQLQ